MNKPFIKMIRVFSTLECVATVDNGDGSETNFTIPETILKGKDLDERYTYMKERANRYIKCIEITEVDDSSDALPFGK